MKQPHKHAELIKAWADGAEIEIWDLTNGVWVASTKPAWLSDLRYRIKPETKPDVVETVAVRPSKAYGVILISSLNANLCLTFDGETGKLKKSEVIE